MGLKSDDRQVEEMEMREGEKNRRIASSREI